MNTLCIWWGYCSGAAVFNQDINKTTLVGASSEERFNRIKNSSLFPINTINWLLELLRRRNLGGLDYIVYAGNDVGVDYLLAEKGVWTVDDYVKENIEFWGPHLLGVGGANTDYLKYLNNKLDLSIWPGIDFWEAIGVSKLNTADINKNFNLKIGDVLSNHFRLSKNSVIRIDHHASHRNYATWTHPNLPKQLLVFTVDGWGDGRNATVAIVSRGNGNTIIENEIFSSKNCSLARTYRFITLLLGMKPSEHEFKVMGLAAYGKESYAKKSFDIFNKSMHYSKAAGDFLCDPAFKDSFFTFRKMLISERFDNIASGLQMWLEKNLEDWVSDFILRLGITDIAFSGGVAMNVKAMARIGELGIVNSLHVPPTPGDESHILGSYYSFKSINKHKYESFNGIPYYGFSNSHIQMIDLPPEYIQVPIDKKFIIKYLKQGSIVSICRGGAEFGARSLGNRSFLIDPSNLEAKLLLNTAVKNRDFWMPFAPIILDEYAEKYIDNYKNLATTENRFMSTIFKTTELGKKHMQSAVHPADGTCRAQILKKDENPFLYSLISDYAIETGHGALLNTSFNKHGFPIVNTIDEALDVLKSTPTNLLILDNYMVIKNSTHTS